MATLLNLSSNYLIRNRFHVTPHILISVTHLNKISGLKMRRVTWNRFPIKRKWW